VKCVQTAYSLAGTNSLLVQTQRTEGKGASFQSIWFNNLLKNSPGGWKQLGKEIAKADHDAGDVKDMVKDFATYVGVASLAEDIVKNRAHSKNLEAAQARIHWQRKFMLLPLLRYSAIAQSQLCSHYLDNTTLAMLRCWGKCVIGLSAAHGCRCSIVRKSL